MQTILSNPNGLTLPVGAKGSNTATSSYPPANNNGAITYTSSNTDVATVDANGEVTVVSTANAGATATITANQAAVATVNRAATASYTISVIVLKTMSDLLSAASPVVPSASDLASQYDTMTRAVLAPYPAGAALVLSRVVHNDDNGLTGKALLCGATIARGNADNGGGMGHYSSAPTLLQVTFTGNTASGKGGGIYGESGGSPTLVNCILWGNTAPAGLPPTPQFNGSGTINYSIVQDGQVDTATTTGLVSTANNPLVGTDANSLITTAGSVQTMALATGSAAINAGLYVKKSGSNYYISTDNATWYEGLTGSGAAAP